MRTLLNKKRSGTETSCDDENNCKSANGSIDAGNGTKPDNLSTIAVMVSSDDSSSNWVDVSSDKSYIPTAADLQCRLRIIVEARAVNDGALLAGPIVLFTEPVLCAPSAPPKRRLLAVPGAGGGALAGAVRFRLLSYNILAEQYATKQVNSKAILSTMLK